MTRVYTIGHSTRALSEYLALLREHGISCLVDVRRWPASRRHPHFAREALADALGREGIEYRHEEHLGGYRKPREDSPNTWWRTRGFQAYADHMEEPVFRRALERVIQSADRAPTAIMCAEATPWRCHRQLISDALVARGHDVIHILGPERAEPHELNENARLLKDGRLIYPEADADQMRLFREED